MLEKFTELSQSNILFARNSRKDHHRIRRRKLLAWHYRNRRTDIRCDTAMRKLISMRSIAVNRPKISFARQTSLAQTIDKLLSRPLVHGLHPVFDFRDRVLRRQACRLLDGSARLINSAHSCQDRCLNRVRLPNFRACPYRLPRPLFSFLKILKLKKAPICGPLPK